MLQNKFEMPLGLIIKKSKLFYLYIFFVFILSVISISISSLLLSEKIVLLAILLIVSVFYFKKMLLNKITALKLNGGNEWKVEINNKQELNVELYGECIASYYLMWLNFSVKDNDGMQKKFHVLLLPDSADKDLLRKLRVRLRFLKSKTAEDTELSL